MPQTVEIYPSVVQAISLAENDSGDLLWKKELANAITSTHQLLKELNLDNYLHIADSQPDFKCLVTPGYLRKMETGNINDPLLRQVLPLLEENNPQSQANGVGDPVGDIDAMNTPGLLHKYHGRALLISTGACAIHCRYCFRRHYPYQQSSCASSVLEQALEYLEQHTEIDEIILSGGDPLILDNEKLASLIHRLESIRHIKTLRIHSRLAVVLPSRINQGLLQLLQSCRFDVVMVIHANHANELQAIESSKLHQLHQAGVTLLNQSVLLKGINDQADTLATLSKRLLTCKTLPYYLHLLDPVKGAMHFEVTQHRAMQLKTQLEQKLPGYLVPKLVQEIAGKQAKTAIFRI
ncbi:MAG: EF-P beta-lysylation protein EpmB [Gammaproteobacteria bacterium]|nr:EF-P beta-lysylation protein EpmB [Gammaproteobacteria bacterium]